MRILIVDRYAVGSSQFYETGQTSFAAVVADLEHAPISEIKEGIEAFPGGKGYDSEERTYIIFDAA